MERIITTPNSKLHAALLVFQEAIADFDFSEDEILDLVMDIRYGKNAKFLSALQKAQADFTGVAEDMGNPTENDIQSWVDEIRYGEVTER
ncbi:MAG: hypothetical protein FWD35_02485 [Oscillospiraceae bacterium]|nr:hypothetical protein [Oscillospiraceae bacterium]